MITKNNFLVLLFSIGYVLFLAYFISNENYFLLLTPVILTVFYLSIFHFKSLFFLVIFLTPLSMSLADIGVNIINVEMAFPTEPILFGLMVMIMFKIGYHFTLFKPIFKHPVTTCIILYLIWMLITCITSSMPLVSFKVVLSRLWYVLPLFFTGVFLFRKKQNISKFVLIYSIPLSIVILYTIFRHSSYFFDKESAHYMMSPFFNDHTSYGAVIAFFIPLLIGAFFQKKNHFLIKVLLLIMLLILVFGLILSFTRAAWISLFIAFVFICFLRLKMNRKLLFIIPPFLIFTFFLFQNSVLNRLQENRQDSSDNLIEHVSSISNISTDASNMERINRWKCAVEMFSEKPVFGWGPGTYQFQYAPFQLHKDRTIISSNQGDMGNAHSEYLGPLAESGFLGLVFFLLFVLVILIRAINLYYKTNDRAIRIWVLASIGSLMSYFIHGAFNNFLDTDKASIGLWAVISILVSLDICNNEKSLKNSKFENNFS